MPEACARCGHVATSDDKFCSGCGALLVDAGIDQTGSITSIIPVATTGGIPTVGSGLGHEIPKGSALLIVHRGPGEGASFALPADADILTVGRSPEAEIFLDDVTVSRRHAEFRRGAEGWSIRDSGSLNGSYVNRVRVDDQRLTGGEEVQIGKFRFVFLVSDAGA